MRPTERDEGAVWRLLRGWADREQERDPLHRKITQGDMARLFGVSTQTVSTWKLCQARMPMASQLKVIQATDISIGELTEALVADEPRIAATVAARQIGALPTEQGETDATVQVLRKKGGGERDRSAATTEPGMSPGNHERAVAAGGSTDEAEIAAAEKAIREAKAEQLEAIEEMKRKKKEAGE